MDNKIKHFGSKQQESSEVSALNKEIKDEKDKINIANADIGEYYWNLYAEGKFKPDDTAKEIFKIIEVSLREIEARKKDIEDRKNAGEEERARIDEETRKREEQKMKDAEERKKVKEAEEIARKEAEGKE